MDIRRAIYTTNAIESLNRSLRKVVKTKSVFPDEKSVLKLMYIAMNNIAKRWTRPIKTGELHFYILLFYPQNALKSEASQAYTKIRILSNYMCERD